MSPRPRTAFSLLEILVAVTIFSICMTALYTAFRTSTRAFESGRQTAEVMQTARFVTQQLAHDLGAVYYDPDFNRKFRQGEDVIWRNRLQVIQSLKEGSAITLPGFPKLLGTKEGGEEHIGDDPYSDTAPAPSSAPAPEAPTDAATPSSAPSPASSAGKSRGRVSGKSSSAEEQPATFIGLKANLRFAGSATDGFDTLEFARFAPSDGTLDNSFMGAERVKYFVRGNNLYRQRTRVFCPVDLNPHIGEELIKASETYEKDREDARSSNNIFIDFRDFRVLSPNGVLPPQFQSPDSVRYFIERPVPSQPPELLACGVTEFAISYGFFNNDAWQEAENWDSESKSHRTPEFNVPVTDKQFGQKLTAYVRRDTDQLPSFIKLNIRIDPSIGFSQNNARAIDTSIKTAANDSPPPAATPVPPKPAKRMAAARRIQTTILIPASRETFVPADSSYFEPSPGTGGEDDDMASDFSAPPAQATPSAPAAPPRPASPIRKK